MFAKGPKRLWNVSNVNKSIESYLDYSYEKYRTYERFKFVKDRMAKNLRSAKDFLDIGCAKGEIIWYLKDFFPEINYTGIDISDELLDLARKEPKLSDARFIRADANDFNLNKKFDIVLMSGVLSIFDDFTRPLRQMMKHIKPAGWGYIFGTFTEDEIDVLVRFRNNYLGSKEWESGHNMFSLRSVEKRLRDFSDTVKLHRFDIQIDLPKEENPVKSYTLNTAERGRIIVNGANIMSQFYLIEFRKKR